MIKTKLLQTIVLALTLYGSVPGSVAAQTPSSCQYILGFQTLHDLVSATVGTCVDNQTFAANGDAQQHSVNGLLAWRKADNWTAFTDGYRTWVNGPNGIQQRLNTQRYSWEADAGSVGTTVIGSPTPPSQSQTSTGCQTQVSAPSTFDPATRTFVYGGNGLAFTIPTDWCVQTPVDVWIEGLLYPPGGALLRAPIPGEAISLSIINRGAEDGDNRANAYFNTFGGPPIYRRTVAGLPAWEGDSTNPPSSQCSAAALVPRITPLGCLPSQWTAVMFLASRPQDTTAQLGLRLYAVAGARITVDSVLATASFVR